MIIFIVPVFNEEENISYLLNKTNEKMLNIKLPYKVIIVDDGSTDNTVKTVESLKDKIPLEIYSHYPNKGVGEAFRVGFRKALEISEDGDVIVTKEADNTSDLGILDKLIAKVEEGYDVALASCYAKEGEILGTTLLRIILSRSVNMLVGLLFPHKGIHTYSSFYRAYNSESLKKLSQIYGKDLIKENGFECVVELLIKFLRDDKFRVIEIPMVLDGRKRKGKSKMRILKTTKGFLKVILKEGIIYRIKRIFKHGPN